MTRTRVYVLVETVVRGVGQHNRGCAVPRVSLDIRPGGAGRRFGCLCRGIAIRGGNNCLKRPSSILLGSNNVLIFFPRNRNGKGALSGVDHSNNEDCARRVGGPPGD